ncbi:TonB-dependent receptor domain-containing protein [Tsuneonella amylolytica]|uniref:TonB-dependent receptor domain-containing protein n=1 Tax=Tsuneonella amylolytica TaxID=2338327 RepID=UPI000EAA7B79|nr:TonB-dependent receptor [Tsuneonella amylolytica]
MKSISLLKAGAAPIALGIAIAATPAFAQDAQTTATDTVDAEEIVVTGSLIQNPNLVQSNPVNVTTSDQIELKQSNLAEEVLREIPGVVANIGSAVNNGNGGSSYADLRGLGSNRNIVLLDGNRIVPVDFSGRVDLNNIPLALVSRVDALTGAAVTTYGADAITGVINFVTRKDFSGVDLNLGQQLTERGDGKYWRADLTMGANFDDGRGNAVLSIGYQKSDPVYQGARDFSQNQISSFTGGGSGSGTTVPSRFTGTRPLTNGAPNTLSQYVQTGTTAAGVPILALQTGGAANGGVRQINAAGQAVGTFQTFNFNPFNVFQTPFERYNIFAQANYEISDGLELYTRGLFSKNSVSTIIAPSGSFNSPVTINLNNPLLPAALRAQFCALNVAPNVTGVNAAGETVSGQIAYTPLLTPAQCAAAAAATGPDDPNYRTITTNLARRAVEVGPRISDYDTTVFDYRFGIRGDLTPTIGFDLSASYGESDKVQTIRNYTLTSRFRQGLLTNNGTTCQDPSNGCIPINVFGPAGTITPAQAAFLTANSTSQVKTTLGQVRALISGDLGFGFGAAEPIGFALGAEMRDYGAEQSSDVLAKTPGELGGAGGAAPDIIGGYKTYEGYGELIVPIIADLATLEAGARYSHQEIDGGPSNNSWTYKVGGTLGPVAGLKVRGNYSRAVRAPNIGELFTPVTTGLTNLGVDPCAGTAPVANANLRAVCIAQGAPAGTIGSIANPTAGQANLTQGGNINLQPEKATTWTAGVVFQPDFLPRFNMSLDYYNIKVKDVIGASLPGDILAACYGSLSAASTTDPNCLAIQRNPVTGGLDGDPSTTLGLIANLNNQGRLFTDGFDLIANYNTDLGFAGWAINFVGNYTMNSKFNANVADPNSLNRECTRYYSVNCSFTGSIQPKWQWSLRNTFTVDDFDLSLLWRHIGSTEHEPQDIIDQGPFFSGTLPASTGAVAGKQVDFNRIDAYDIFDATLRWNVSDEFTFTFAVQNLLDKQPPIVGNTAGATTYNSGNTYPSTYDALGRRYAVGARIRF